MSNTNKAAQDEARMEELKRRAKQVMLEIVRQASGHELKGKLKLFKAFYLAHLLYTEEAQRYLTEWPIVRMPNGPGIHAGDRLLSELIEEGTLLVRSKNRLTEPSPPEEYQWTGKEPTESPLPDAAVKAIREAVEFVADKTALELSQWTHEVSRSWNSAHDGDELNIYIDLIPEEEYLIQSKKIDNIWMAIEWQDRPIEDDERSP